MRLLLATLILLVALTVPFLLFGARLEAEAAAALARARGEPGWAAALVVALLTADVLLPVPSSIVGGFAGAVLGLAAGAVATWAGLMLGTVAGYWLGRAIPARALAVAGGGAAPAAPIMLSLTRAIPVLAEAGLIAAGAARMRFSHVLVAVAPANLAVALAYAGAGHVLAGVDPALAAVAGAALCAAAWTLPLIVRRRRRTGS